LLAKVPLGRLHRPQAIPLTDIGPTDIGPTDMGPTDMGPTDMGPTDMGPTDMGPKLALLSRGGG